MKWQGKTCRSGGGAGPPARPRIKRDFIILPSFIVHYNRVGNNFGSVVVAYAAASADLALVVDA